MIRRARLIAVVATVLAGAVGVISSTQTWLAVTLADGAQGALLVPGAAAVPVLAPLSLAVLALGAALSIVGLVLRYVFGVLTVAIGGILSVLTFQAYAPGVRQVAATVTEATGITGDGAVSALVSSITITPWVAVTHVASVLLFAVGVFVLVTARRWKSAGRRYSTETAAAASAGSRPHDAIDNWDGLSRGEDPTARPLD